MIPVVAFILALLFGMHGEWRCDGHDQRACKGKLRLERRF